MRLVTAIITQIFSYMIQMGLQYGFVSTGETYIFLKIADDPSTVYYYLSIPDQDMEQADDWQRMAVAQVFAFTLQALTAGRPPQSWGIAAEDLGTWAVEYEDVLRNIPPILRKEHSPTPYKAGKWKGVERSRIKTRSRRRRTSDQMNDDDTPPSPSPRDQREGGRGQEESGKRGGKTNKGDNISRQYCTQECLRGLLTGGTLDKSCPNVEDHGGKGNGKHVVNRSAFLRMMRHQLACDRDTDCEPLYIQGARGTLFRLTLSSHGYTVAAKGTISAFTPYLRHEAAISEQLRPIQGIHIPVCLGTIDLVTPYYHIGDQIVLFLFLGWGGIRIDRHIDCHNKNNVVAQATSSLRAIHQLGVLHRDAMPRNMLWNTKSSGVIVVDFERAEIVERKRAKKRVELGTLSPNQRSRSQENAEMKTDGETGKGDGKNRAQFTIELERMRVELARNVH
jgi:tRNA A-37 threonylcarbamoyl transferase component Bud32